MKVSLSEDGSKLTVEMAVSPRTSKSGKSTVVATSSGNKTFSDVLFDGKPITIGVNAYVSKV